MLNVDEHFFHKKMPFYVRRELGRESSITHNSNKLKNNDNNEGKILNATQNKATRLQR